MLKCARFRVEHIRGGAAGNQYNTWSSFLLGAVALLASAAAVLLSRPSEHQDSMPAEGAEEPVAPRRVLYWIALSFVPSSLLLGVTTYLTANLASAPLLWVVPLALYLLTFVLAFSARRRFTSALNSGLFSSSAAVRTFSTEPFSST